MKISRYSFFFICVLVISGISFIAINKSVGDSSSEKMFVSKNYGELKISGRHQEQPSRYESLLFKHHGISNIYDIDYMRKSENGIYKAQASVRIMEFTDEDYAKNELLIFYFTRRDIIRFIKSRQVVEITKADGGFSWISDAKYIKIYYYKVDGSTREQILEDYLSLHPPTVKIHDSDFNPQKIIKTQIKRSHDIIKDADKMRILPARLTLGLPRAEAYIGMVAQCMAELSIRCWTGMYEGEAVDCPITFIQNDIKRNKKWKKFKSEYMSRPVVEENIVLDSISYAGSPTCAFKHEDVEEGTDPSDMWSIVMDELNMDYKELRALSLTGEKIPSAFIRR